jgi:hypothetical protein
METFVIQIPTQPEDTDATSAPDLRGVVEHVGSGSRHPFADSRELLTLLRADYRGLPKEVER